MSAGESTGKFRESLELERLMIETFGPDSIEDAA